MKDRMFLSGKWSWKEHSLHRMRLQKELFPKKKLCSFKDLQNKNCMRENKGDEKRTKNR